MGINAKYRYEYITWINIRQRCFNKNCKSYQHYGGRGITMSPEWRGSFLTFYKDMGRKPSKNMTIERVDNNGNYTKENCIWATRKTQGRNNRGNKLLTINGETKCLAYWAEFFNVDYQLACWRIRKKWPLSKVFEAPKQKKRMIRLFKNGKEIIIKTERRAVEIIGVTPAAFYRVKKKMKTPYRGFDIIY